MFGAPKRRGWYCMDCDTSNKEKDQICSNCKKLRDGQMVEFKEQKKFINTGEDLTADDIKKRFRE